MADRLPLSVLDALRAIYALLARPQSFTGDAMARDRAGAPCDPEAENAIAFDIAGAIWRVIPGQSTRAIQLRNTTWQALGGPSMTQLRTHRAALDLLTETGKRLQGERPALELTA